MREGYFSNIIKRVDPKQPRRMRENYSKAISSEGSILWRIREHSAIGSSQGEEFVVIKGD
jgi:hypothetical protein